MRYVTFQFQNSEMQYWTIDDIEIECRYLNSLKIDKFFEERFVVASFYCS